MVEPDFRFQELQYRFAAHLREPAVHPAPAGIEDRRLNIYRELLYRNVEGFIANSFPVLRKIIDDQRWHAMVRDYFHRHKARTPLFPRMPQEFLRYLADERDATGDPPFMLELAHYEWLELEASLDAQEIEDCVFDDSGDLEHDIPVLNPIARPYAYRFPVHRISPAFQPAQPPATPSYLVVLRDRLDDVGFMELNPVTARLVELMMRGEDVCGGALLERIAAELNHPQPEVVIVRGLEIMAKMRDRDVILGTRRMP